MTNTTSTPMRRSEKRVASHARNDISDQLLFDDISNTTNRRNELSAPPRIDLLAQVIDHHIHDVGPGVKVVPPGVLGDQCPAHHPPGVPHEVLEDRELLWRQL